MTCSSAFALDPAKALSQYQQRAWSSEAGLPANYVNAVVHARDGYLWLGTEEGLARFDGFTFTVFDRRNTPAFTDHNVQALHEDPQGTLWIGTRGAGVLRYRDGAFTALTSKNGLPSDRVLAIDSTPDGWTWVATNGGGLVRTRAGQFETFTTRNGLSDDRVVALTVDGAGTLWAGYTSGGVDHVVAGRIRRYPPPAPMDPVVAIEAARDGSIWIGTRSHGIFRLEGDRLEPIRGSPPTLRLLSLHEDRDGNMWAGTNGQGLLRIRDGASAAYTVATGFPSDVVVIVTEDSDGGLWAGTGGAGIVQVRDTPFTPFGRPEGLSHDIALAVLEDRSGALWVGTYGGGLNRIDGGRSAPAGPPALRQATVYSLLEDSRGSMWVGTGEAGLVQITAGGSVTHSARNGFTGDSIYALVEDGGGAIWAGTRTGAWRYDGGRWTTVGAPQGLANPFVRALTRARDGSVWIGTNGGGVTHYRDGRLDTFTSPDNLANFVRAIHEDASGNVWIGTSGGGLNLLRDGRFLPLTTRAGLPDDVVYAIVEDGQGRFWMSSNRGIFSASREELLKVAGQPGAQLTSALYGVGDGMRSAEGNGGFQPAAARTRSGRIWFPTIRGVVAVDPERLQGTAGEPPRVALEQVAINREAIDVRQAAETPAGAGDLVFRYTGLALPDPARVRFQYWLENFDPGWVDAGARREAFYTNIPPGRYTFRVRAASAGAGRDNIWSEPAAFALSLQPRFYQTGLFFTTVVLTVVLLLMGGYRWRLRVLRDLQADLMRLVRERTDELEDANRKLAQMSYVDAVTAVSNRRSFEEELTMEWRRSMRNKSPLSLLMIDVDGFKAFNDALGHQEGDACLRKVATVIDECVQRAGDTLARYGGEEFAILLPETGVDGAAVLGERIRSAVEDRNIWHPGSPSGRLTVSVGVASASGAEQAEPASLVRAADAALYQAKRDGRNLVRLAAPGGD